MREREPQISYVSALAPYLHQFVAEKRTLGCKFQTQAAILCPFDRFLAEQEAASPDLSKPLLEAWMRKRPHESHSTHQGRICVARQFCLFLVRRGFRPHVPDPRLLPRFARTFVPYVFSYDEIRRLLAAADQIPRDRRSPQRHLMFPFIFRLLYGCGLRIGEALHLQVKDVDAARGVLTIRKAKFCKDRLVPLAPSLAEQLRRYADACLSASVPAEFAFPAPDGGPFNHQTIHGIFRRLLWACGISYRGRGEGPRLHDLRHTFAVHRLMAWYREGMDMGVALPILATYLGHDSLSGTQRYLQLTAEMYPDVVAALQARYGDLIPQKEM
jgi:integrase